MDPRETIWHRYQGRIDAIKPIERIRTAYADAHKHAPSEKAKGQQTRQLPTERQRPRTSRIAGFVRSHKMSFIGGAIAAFALGIGGEVFRRLRGKR